METTNTTTTTDTTQTTSSNAQTDQLTVKLAGHYIWNLVNLATNACTIEEVGKIHISLRL